MCERVCEGVDPVTLVFVVLARTPRRGVSNSSYKLHLSANGTHT